MVTKKNILCLFILTCMVSFSERLWAQAEFSIAHENLQKIDALSSDAEEVNPLFLASANRIYFSRIAPPSEAQSSALDIYSSTFENNRWSSPSPVSTLNDEGQNVVVGMNTDGSKLYLLETKSGQKGMRKINYSGQKPHPTDIELELDPKIQQIYSVYWQPTFQLAVVSIGYDSLSRRKKDLFLYKQINSRWRKIYITSINSTYDEITPFISEDSVLYFASNRPGGLGSYDIYAAKAKNESFTQWTKPIHLGDSVNSTAFDAYFASYGGGFEFFVSNRDGGHSDLYQCNRKATIQPKKTAEASIKDEVDDKADDNLEETKNIEIAAEIEKKGQSLPSYIYYGTNSYEIDDSAKKVLKPLVTYLNQNNKIQVELRGYSDNKGDPEYNLKLSIKRSEEVKAYLIARGIDVKRIHTVGAGVKSPLGDNSTEEGRAQNRRVRLILHKNNKKKKKKKR